MLDILKQMISEFAVTVPVVEALRNPKFTSAHWEDIKMNILCEDFNLEDPDFNLAALLNMDIFTYQQQLIEISVQATQEDIIQQQYNQLSSEWKSLELEFQFYKSEVFKLLQAQEGHLHSRQGAAPRL